MYSSSIEGGDRGPDKSPVRVESGGGKLMGLISPPGVIQQYLPDVQIHSPALRMSEFRSWEVEGLRLPTDVDMPLLDVADICCRLVFVMCCLTGPVLAMIGRLSDMCACHVLTPCDDLFCMYMSLSRCAGRLTD